MIKKYLILLCALFSISYALADPVWIDVRTAGEYASDHIEGDIRISYQEIVPEVKKRFPDQSTEIRLYCRTGNRANIAVSSLKAAGYNHVSNAGNIDQARQERGLTQK